MVLARRVLPVAAAVSLTLSPLRTVVLPAQEISPVPEGTTVKLWAPEYGFNKSKVTVLEWTDSAGSFLRLRPLPDTSAVPFRGITRLDQLRGKNTALGVLRGAGIGGAVGMVVGLIIGESATQGCQGFLCELEALNSAGIGFGIGLAAGGVLGAAHPPDRWVRVDLPTSAGFPPYQQPFHETISFKLLSVGAGLLLTALLSGS